MLFFEPVEEELGECATAGGPALLAEAPKGTMANWEEDSAAELFVAGASTNKLFKTLSMAAFSSGAAFSSASDIHMDFASLACIEPSQSGFFDQLCLQNLR